MAKGRSKGNNQNNKNKGPQKVTTDTVKNSTSESEFLKNKETLIAEFDKEIKDLEKKKLEAEQALESLNEKKENVDKELKGLLKDKEETQKLLDSVQEEYDKAADVIDHAETKAAEIKKKAETEAKDIIEGADKERLEKIAEAASEAKKAWEEQIQNIQVQLKDISERERKLNDEKIALDKEKQTFDFDKEALDEMKEHVMHMKERYAAANPGKIDELELTISDEQKKYEVLLKKYDAVTDRLADSQALLDTIKTEVEDPNSGVKIASMKEIVSAMHDFKEKYENLAAIYTRYPDDESIMNLEEKAMKVDRLERENDALEQERNRYREEAVAARNASKELEVVRQEVEATNALNEHLLQELESHKTALESRTGDTCPSLTKVDAEIDEDDFIANIQKRQRTPELTSLKEVVDHVKNYAGSRTKDKRLYYTDNDIRAFLAGMSVSRLIILQGMSGTGKSSLPRIFSEAISGFNKLIPVESSWRDRNELLGYYNDFNKKFNAKSFTIELYRSSKERCRTIPTFIVLDEMNLARIEYYFSDFLAILQEPDHSKWLIELVSSDMRTLPMELPKEVRAKMQREEPSIFAIWEKIEKSRQGDLKSETSDEEKEQLTAYLAKLGHLTGAKDLVAGRKIKVTDNIWFIGTANQDESTFEISDKVYDRAQVVSLNRKGTPEGKYKDSVEKFVSVDALSGMFEDAIKDFKHKNEVDDKLESLDSVLVEKFDVSFGNRIVTQTEDFAAVFTAAGGTLNDALDYQISTKILRKVITSDDGEAFLDLLDATKDYPETQRLINKRIKDLR